MVSFRRAQLTDAPALHQNCFPAQTLDEVRDYLRWCMAQQARRRVVRLVAEVDGQVIANGQLTLQRDRGEIGSLVVAAPHRQRGIGTALVRALVEQARRHHLKTVELSAPTGSPWIRAWYERLGFVYQGHHTFPGPEEVALLRMSLLDSSKETQPCPPTEA
jgi:ribosomal protein S18 acetylase RimI-like enzyme